MTNHLNLRTAVAALLVGITGVVAAATADAQDIKKLQLCQNFDANGQIAYGESVQTSGLSKRPCVTLTALAKHPSETPVMALGYADFKTFEGLPFDLVKNPKESLINHSKCTQSYVRVTLLSWEGSGWKQVETKQANAKPEISGGKISKCFANVGTGYHLGSGQYRSTVWSFSSGKSSRHPKTAQISGKPPMETQ